MDGLFKRPLAWPDVSSSEPGVHVIPAEDDFLIHIDEDNCPRFGQVKNALENHPRTKKMYEKMRIDWEENYFPRLRNLTGIQDDDMYNVANYLYWAY